MMMKFFILIISLMSCILVCYVFLKVYRVRHTIQLNDHHMTRLLTLARQSLDSLDVPIGALLIYENEIIGEGYNTVFRVSDAGGHAEINAISDAIKRLGMERFNSLNRDFLFLVTTFQPCLMCVGAFINYNIKQVYFLKEKDFLYMSKEGARFIRYYFRRRKMQHAGEQDALFEQHPRYPLRKINTDLER